MKVLVFAAYMAPHTGGYCRNIQELSKRLVARGHAVTVVTCNTEGYPEEEYMDGVKILRLPAWDLLNKTYPVPKPSLQALRIWIGKPDVVITQTRFFATSLMGTFYSLLGGYKHIHVERGSVHTVLGSPIISWCGRVYDHTFGTFVVKHAKQNVGVSKAACQFVKHIGGKKTQTIYNGIDVA